MMAIRGFVFLAFMWTLVMTVTCARAEELDERVEETLRWMPADAQGLVVTNLWEKEIFTDSVLFPMTEPGMGWQLYFLRPVWALDQVMRSGTPDLCIDCILKGGELNPDGGDSTCQFLYLKGDPFLYESQKQDLQAKAVRTYKEGEHLIAEFGRTGTVHDQRFYRVCMPKPGLVVGATTRNAMTQVLTRIDANKKREAFPSTWPEWKSVNSHAPCWGFRRFAPGDPTSPASPQDGVKIDPKAISLAFSYNPERKHTVVTYRSTNPDIKRIATALAGINQATRDWNSVIYSSPEKGTLKIVVANEPGHFPHVLWTSLCYWFGESKIPDNMLEECLDRLRKKRKFIEG